MNHCLLPPAFTELEAHVDWSLSSESERLQKRLGSSMEDIQAFYSIMLGRIEEALDYLNGFPLEQLPEPEQRLLNMTLSLAEIWVAVELYKQPGPPFRSGHAAFCSGKNGDRPRFSLQKTWSVPCFQEND